MATFVVDQIFNEIEQINTNIRSRSKQALLLKINNRKAKKILRLDNCSGLIDVNSNKPNKRREYDRHQIKERLRKKLEKRNENKCTITQLTEEEVDELKKLNPEGFIFD